tara:strand:- start:291 stop:1376 length:1086 start_codon:yes stop_codon:yes gene_type:complete
MARNIIKTNNAVIAVQNTATAFSTSNLDLNLYAGVQSANFSLSYSRADLKQLGSQGLVTRDTIRQPDVTLNIDYLPEPKFGNEEFSHFRDSAVNVTSQYASFFSNVGDRSTNFYFLITPDEDQDAISNLTFDETLLDLDGFTSLSFGNCYPTQYRISYAVGGLPKVSTSYICSNTKFEPLTGTSMQSPAINLESGNNNEVGLSLFQFDQGNTDPIIVNPASTGSSVNLQNLQVGGQNISGVHLVQSVSLAVDIPRTSNYGLGSDYAYGREPQYPARGVFEVSSLVSGMESGAMSGVLKNDSDYSFELVLEGSGKQMIYQINDAKLNNYSYSSSLGEFFNFNASFSFEVTEATGLQISGTNY